VVPMVSICVVGDLESIQGSADAGEP